MAIENGPIEDVFPIEHVTWGYSIATLGYQRVQFYFFKGGLCAPTFRCKAHPSAQRKALADATHQTNPCQFNKFGR